MNTDRIEKTILLKAPLERVWRALSDSQEFGTWFGVRFEGPFEPGASMCGVIVGTKVNADIAQAQQQYKGKRFEITIEKMEPGKLFSFRWHPHATDPGVDYSAEPTTLVVFALEEVDGGVKLTVSESGFDRIPLARRATAFSSNEQGWSMMIQVVKEYLARPA